MKRLLLILMTTVALAQQNNTPLKPGGAEGTGGDPIYNRFVRVKQRAQTILRWVHPSWMLAYSEKWGKFYADNDKQDSQIAQDLENSDFDLRIDNPNNKCGYTTKNPRAKIWFSRRMCPPLETLADLELEAVFIGEAGHHFGLNDQEAAEFGMAVINAWRRGIPASGEWICRGSDSFLKKIDFRRNQKNELQGTWYVYPEYDFSDASNEKPWKSDFTFPGTIDFTGQYKKGSCTFRYSLRATVSRDAKSVTVHGTRPWTVYPDCRVTEYRNSSYTCTRPTQPTPAVGPLQAAPFNFILNGQLPAPFKPTGKPWEFIHGK